ncbi:aspartate aminotransferase family protein [Paenibacillus sp. N4]|uniref:pyridoxal phosphate-dependent decarboxylase family protein n=1 Tax=Paenibacillus vietnamensis TaxID=2590547 RepID=UPI001CD07A50|nr:pyridoxal-dependent decarboxylase [Paenibacillus vietnamensis]MCA0756617.1 aspartate aminotransferase family protein [Paenibacillus vietnamensis]
MESMRETGLKGLFPSDDGNAEQREHLLGLIGQIVSGVDELKDPESVFLKGTKERGASFYRDLVQSSLIPAQGRPMSEVSGELLKLLHAHPYHTKYFLTNILPMASIPGILGMIAAFMVNGNNLWDVYGPAGAEAEVRVVSMMSKLVGYDADASGGYTTWGGQGAIFTGLRLAIQSFVPEASKNGVPGNLYAFCSEAAHYSLYKSMEATGLGSGNLVKVKTRADSSMDTADLREKMEMVLQNGGVPIYVVATTGTTDAMGIDSLDEVYGTVLSLAEKSGLPRARIHADSALGGFFAFFNDYDFVRNPLSFSAEVSASLQAIRSRMKYLHLADSLCFDFQKLGQTPYSTSLFLVKQAADLKLLDLEPDETPYVGHRGYGQYHTSYTLECSRMGSSISIYSALLAFGTEGYQRLLGQFVEVNEAFRRVLAKEIPEAVIVNPDNPGIITLFRIYEGGRNDFAKELGGRLSRETIDRTNRLNEMLFEILGRDRAEMFFGDTKKHLYVPASDGGRLALYASKLFVISPFTRAGDVESIVSYLKERVQETYAAYRRMTSGGLVNEEVYL